MIVGDTIPAKFQTISFSVNEKLKDSRRRDRTTSEKRLVAVIMIKSKCLLTHLQLGKFKATARRTVSQDDELMTPINTYMQARPPPEKVILIRR